MKRVVLILASSLLLLGVVIFLLLSGTQKEQAFYLNDKYYGNSSLIEIDSEKLKALEKDKTSFAIFVYQPFCTTSYDFNNNIIEFLDIHKMSFYKILFSNIKDTSMASYVKYCPSVVIYHNGKIVAYLDASSGKDAPYYETVDGFKKWFTKYVLLK